MKASLIAVLIFSSVVLLTTSGCGTARLWGGKASGSPARLGGDISIPLGKP
jgi:hypothetical protein